LYRLGHTVLSMSRRYATSPSLDGEKLGYGPDGIRPRGRLSTDGGATASAWFIAVADLGAIVHRIVRRIEAMVRLGIHGDAHRRAECLGTLGPLHAWRRWSPVVLGTDEHEQRRVGPVIRCTRVLPQTARV